MSQRTGWPPLPSYDGPPRPPRRSHSLTIAAVAIAAFAAAVVAAVLIVGGLTGPPSTAGSASSAAPAQGSQDGGAAGGGPVTGGGGGGGQLFLGGKVTAVSATSITLTGQGQSFTAAITRSTKFTGVRGPSGIKVGTEVSAQITGYDSGHPVATAIQDPPAGFP